MVLRNLELRIRKEAYVPAVRERYRSDIGAFNSVYGTSFASFDDLLKARSWRPSEDNQNAREVENHLQFTGSSIGATRRRSL